MDVRVRIVDEHARLDIACSIDMQIAASASDATTDIFAVVLEVQREERLCLAHLVVEEVELLALFRRRHEIGRRILADRHISEDPREERALIDQPIDVFLARNAI